MSTRRKQSTKDLGELLNQAVPVLSEEDQHPPSGAEPVSRAEEGAQAAANEPDGEDSGRADEELAGSAVVQPELAASGETIAPHLPDAPDSMPPGSSAPDERQDRAAANESPSETEQAVDDDASDAAQTEPPVQSAPDAELHFVDAAGSQRVVRTDNRSAVADESPETLIEPLSWRKSTIPFREDQYNEIGRLLAEFRAEHGVQLTIAEFVRLGLDKQIQAFQDADARPALLAELYEQQRRESQGNQNLKHSRSHGLGQFLAQS